MSQAVQIPDYKARLGREVVLSRHWAVCIARFRKWGVCFCPGYQIFRRDSCSRGGLGWRNLVIRSKLEIAWWWTRGIRLHSVVSAETDVWNGLPHGNYLW